MLRVIRRNPALYWVYPACWAVLLVCLALVLGVARAEEPVRDSGDPIGERYDYGLDLTHYATVHRRDGSFRRMLATRNALAADPNQPFPDGTHILMETYLGPDARSTVFHTRKVEGRWLWGSFGERVDLTVRANASCAQCHESARETDGLFTAASLWRRAEGAEAAMILCERSGRTPCAPHVYERDLKWP